MAPATFDGRNLHFGVREHAMGSVCNGIAVHGGAIPYASTFLIFSDYMRPALRLSALMEQQVIYVFTHDSIGLGEDGPTHQPIEHLDVSSRHAKFGGHPPCRRHGNRRRLAGCPGNGAAAPPPSPSAARTFQSLDPSTGSASANCLPSAEGAAKGGYILWEDTPIPGGEGPQVIIIATGSEVHIALGSCPSL